MRIGLLSLRVGDILCQAQDWHQKYETTSFNPGLKLSSFRLLSLEMMSLGGSVEDMCEFVQFICGSIRANGPIPMIGHSHTAHVDMGTAKDDRNDCRIFCSGLCYRQARSSNSCAIRCQSSCYSFRELFFGELYEPILTNGYEKQ